MGHRAPGVHMGIAPLPLFRLGYGATSLRSPGGSGKSMARLILRCFSCAFFFALLVSMPVLGQQVAASNSKTNMNDSYPSGDPGVYMQDATGWHLLSQNTSFKAKVKHGVLSGLTYGAVAAPMVVEYAGAHATVQAHTAKPRICVYHLLTSGQPLLVHLSQKKQKRDLDSGTMHVLPIVGASHQVGANAGSLVAITTQSNDACKILMQPTSDLADGEYAVMFGAQNVAIFDFGVSTTQ